MIAFTGICDVAEKLMEEYVRNIAAAAGADTDYYTVHWNYRNG